MNTRRRASAVGRWLGRAWPPAGADNRGIAFITTVYVVFVLGMMLFAFIFINQNEVGFAAFNRNDTVALGLAEAGIQDAVTRLTISGATPGTCFWNSLTGGTGQACTGTAGVPLPNAVAYQLTLPNNSVVFPILSEATYGGTLRAVRIWEQASFKSGFGTIVFGPQVRYQGDASPITGDSYSQLSLTFQNYAKSPAPATGATATNLVSPQVMAGGQISDQAAGDPGPYTFECGSIAASSTGGPIQLTEVAPTPCPGGRAVDGKSNPVPVNWHPMTPAGMSAGDFNAVIMVWNGNNANLDAILGPGQVSVYQATQNNVGVTYSPVSYSPPYWSLAGTAGKVYQIAANNTAFCVKAGTTPQVTAPPCLAGFNSYGNATLQLRYIDWGLVSDDQTRAFATTFYQPPTCSTCNNGGANGYQNGIRYIPLLPSINAQAGSPTAAVLSFACSVNINPGTNVFDNVSGDGKTCPSPPTILNPTSNITFTGTQTNPEFLVIDNGPPGTCPGGVTCVSITGTGTVTGCTDNFANANWGVILATGDIKLQQGMKFNGFIYTPGNVYSYGNPIIKGGIFSATPPGTSVDQIDQLGTLTFCGGVTTMPLIPQFYTFKTISGTWQDRPANQP